MNLHFNRMLHVGRTLFATAVTLGLLLGESGAYAADDDEDHAARSALQAYKDGSSRPPPVANRFFIKEQRLELAPSAGIVTNNSFARRFIGSLQLGYHISDNVSLQFQGLLSPDFGESDLKDLTAVLLERANTRASNQGETGDFQQPLEKLLGAGSLAVAWAPVYGKINLVGETVLNFDFYLTGGVGAVFKRNFAAEFEDIDPTPEDGRTVQDIVELVPPDNPSFDEVLPAVVLGVGQNYFVSQTVAVKIDARAYLWLDNEPLYTADQQTRTIIFNNFIASAGVSLFFPKMKPRLYDF
ncbi:MAG: outer membrane beta-barrel domain-containing protein [Myxococcota bacterium]